MNQGIAFGVVVGIWALVAVIAIGVHREITGKFDEDFAIPAAFWPVMAIIGAAFGTAWCLLWIGRAPILLWRWHRRVRMPKARTVRR
jgi:hypothetical protein